MFSRLLYYIFLFFPNFRSIIPLIALIAFLSIGLTLLVGKVYQHWDKDKHRGAIAISEGAFGEDFITPVYLKEKDSENAQQGWSKADSLWFYSTTQGSALLPYDFFIELEKENSQEKFKSIRNISKFRYLPQNVTFSNPDALPVGFAKESYRGGKNSCFDNLFGGITGKGKDYVGYTCAACHTNQINYKDKKNGNNIAVAIRIDGGPAMADMVGFLINLESALESTLKIKEKRSRFIKNVLARNNDYDSEESIINDLKIWSEKIGNYNRINRSSVKYGYARLDAFGRIYNRVIEHVINKPQLKLELARVTDRNNKILLTSQQLKVLLNGVEGEIILGQKNFAKFIKQLNEISLPYEHKQRILSNIFNEPNAPVSYPYLWDIAQSDYVQWNAIASNAEVGPLARNTGEVIGVFGILDWHEDNGCLTKIKRILPDWVVSPAAWISGQKNKKKNINFKSSVDIVNLKRLESMLRRLKSPQWPEQLFGKIQVKKAERGRLIYIQYCQSCHEVIERNEWSRRVTVKIEKLKRIGTDPQMALNSVKYSGAAGNLKNTLQDTELGKLVIQQKAPVVQTLTAAVKGVIATPDPDKWFFRRWADRVYTVVMSLVENKIEKTIKSGNYNPDTTAEPYSSLLSYKARSLNGIWATAPFLHNGSVPTLYDLMLPPTQRPKTFYICKREFDPKKIGFVNEEENFSDLTDEDKEACKFDTSQLGNFNGGHYYRTNLKSEEIYDLLEYLKSL